MMLEYIIFGFIRGVSNKANRQRDLYILEIYNVLLKIYLDL